MRPSLSVVLVTRNAMPYATSAITQAAEAEQRWGAQVIAIDAASDDGTWQALSDHPQWTLRQQQSTGLAAARNEALGLVTGDVIAFLDSDDQWLPGKTEAQLRVLSDQPHIGVVSCRLRRVDLGTDGPAASGDAGEPDQAALTPSGCLIRRQVFDLLGGFDTRYTIAADHEWFVRAQAAHVGLVVLPDVFVHKGVHAGNLSHDRSTYRRELAQVFRSLSGDPEPARAADRG